MSKIKRPEPPENVDFNPGLLPLKLTKPEKATLIAVGIFALISMVIAVIKIISLIKK
jgi:hypothetical protein